MINNSTTHIHDDGSIDPFNICVNILNQEIPLIISFGPRSSGKTMTIIRRTRYLRKEGYEVVPIRTFRPESDVRYGHLCDDFLNIAYSDYFEVKCLDLMLVEVRKKNRGICQFVEIPGEFFFDIDCQNLPIHPIISYLMNRSNPKTWVIFAGLNYWADNETLKMYSRKIIQFKSNIISKDKFIILASMVDHLQNYYEMFRHDFHDLIIERLNSMYPYMLDEFKQTNRIKRIFETYTCDIVPFSSGIFCNDKSNKYIYIQGDNQFPYLLWKSIISKIK